MFHAFRYLLTNAQNVGGAVTGDKQKQAEGAAREEKGDTKRDFA